MRSSRRSSAAACGTATVTVAQTLAPLVAAVLGPDAPIRVGCWDGSELSPPGALGSVTIVNRRALRRLLWAPNELGFARAYVAGDIVVDDDLAGILAALERTADPATGPGLTGGASAARAAVGAALRLGAIGPPPRPPAEEVRLVGRRHSRRRDVAAVSHHYDVGNDFYRLVLGPTMVYSCGYWTTPDSGLDDAQRTKCDVVARKLGLGSGMRLLDVGCGWGTFVLHAARHYGVSAVGVTLSEAQADAARARVAEHGLDSQVEIRVQDYRDVVDGPYDAIASIGMAEHVGGALLSAYARRLYTLLRPGGRLLNHAISRRPGPTVPPSKTSFVHRYVFPDGELQPLASMVDTLEEVGFEVRDVESLREHYGLTLRAWVDNLERDWDRACTLTSVGRARVWQLYMAGAALGFDGGRLGVNQVLAVRPEAGGRSGMPLARASSTALTMAGR